MPPKTTMAKKQKRSSVTDKMLSPTEKILPGVARKPRITFQAIIVPGILCHPLLRSDATQDNDRKEAEAAERDGHDVIAS
jgi:hypothetical protein